MELEYASREMAEAQTPVRPVASKSVSLENLWIFVKAFPDAQRERDIELAAFKRVCCWKLIRMEVEFLRQGILIYPFELGPHYVKGPLWSSNNLPSPRISNLD